MGHTTNPELYLLEFFSLRTSYPCFLFLILGGPHANAMFHPQRLLRRDRGDTFEASPI
jgi:hypothetical protein